MYEHSIWKTCLIFLLIIYLYEKRKSFIIQQCAMEIMLWFLEKNTNNWVNGLRIHMLLACCVIETKYLCYLHRIPSFININLYFIPCMPSRLLLIAMCVNHILRYAYFQNIAHSREYQFTILHYAYPWTLLIDINIKYIAPCIAYTCKFYVSFQLMLNGCLSDIQRR